MNLTVKIEFETASSLDSIGFAWQMQPIMSVAICERKIIKKTDGYIIIHL